jgi:hypothetical protein
MGPKYCAAQRMRPDWGLRSGNIGRPLGQPSGLSSDHPQALWRHRWGVFMALWLTLFLALALTHYWAVFAAAWLLFGALCLAILLNWRGIAQELWLNSTWQRHPDQLTLRLMRTAIGGGASPCADGRHRRGDSRPYVVPTSGCIRQHSRTPVALGHHRLLNAFLLG